MEQNKLATIIVGGSGAIGREVVSQLLQNPNYSAVHLITRRVLDSWKDHKNFSKLKIHQVESLDELENQEKWQFLKDEKINSAMCLLGSRTKEGKEKFYKVDYTYCDWFGKISKQAGIENFAICSSTGANSRSWFTYPRVKGEIENQLKTIGFDNLSIFRPGFLLNRDNDKRFGEGVAKYVPFFPKIESKDCASVIIKISERKLDSKTAIFENSDMLKVI